jgi:Zn-dependent peptidase ImmA (M78 family)
VGELIDMTPSEQLEIINHYRKNAPVDVHGIASSLGIRIHEAFLPDNVSGIIERAKDGNFLVTVNTFDSYTRKRFTIAHELGHFMLHRGMIGDGIEDDRAYRSTTSGKYRNNLIGPREETQANSFAANVLMPYELIQRLQAEGYATPEQLADKLQVSVHAMSIRLGLPYAA